MHRIMLIAVAALLATPAFACVRNTPEPDRGQHIEKYDEEDLGDASVNSEAALAIAARRGLTQVSKLELDRGLWEIKGSNQLGMCMELVVDAQSGRVVELDYGHPPHGYKRR